VNIDAWGQNVLLSWSGFIADQQPANSGLTKTPLPHSQSTAVICQDSFFSSLLVLTSLLAFIAGKC